MTAAGCGPASTSGPASAPPPGQGDLGLVDALAQLAFAVHAALVRIAATHDLSIVQARLLGILRDRSPTITELSGFLQLDKSSVTGLVDRAEERGLVRRAASTDDRRSVHVVLTTTGREVIDQAAPTLAGEIAHLVADLSPSQRNRLSVLASRVVAADARRRGVDPVEFTPVAHAQVS